MSGANLTMNDMQELRGVLGQIRDEQGETRATLEFILKHLEKLNGRTAKTEERCGVIENSVRDTMAEARGAWKVITAGAAIIGAAVSWAAKHFLPLLFLAVVAHGQTATISDTLYSSVGGGAWTGKIAVTLNSPGSAQPLYSGTTSLAGWSQTLCIGVTGGDCTTQTSAGVVTATLYTNSAITPSGTSYSARFTPSRGTAWMETWDVTAGDTKLYQIRATTVPSPTVTLQVTQIVPGSNGQCLLTSGGASAWGTCPSGGMADPGANGLLVRTASNTTVNRTLTGTANQISVANGDGVSGNPTLSIPTNPTLPGTTTGTFSGPLTGNASTATALAANPADCAAGSYATSIAANGDLTCSAPNTAVASAVYTLSVDNSTTFSNIASILMPAMAAGTRFQILVSTTNASGVGWEFKPMVGSSTIYTYRDASAGTDTTSAQSVTCHVFSSSSLVCNGLYLRSNGSQGSIDWVDSGSAVLDRAYDVTSAWTLNIDARTVSGTTTNIPFGISVLIYPAV